MRFPTVTLRLPGWVEEFAPGPEHVYETAEERMRLAIALAHENVRRETGGPFGAAVFDRDSGRLVAPGVNLVVASCCSTFHAEMVAIMVAQQAIGGFDLGADGQPPYELFASAEPCAMCLGATPWSGVRGLVCGARGEDAEEIGFDEGSKPDEWVRLLEDRGISVARDVCRDEAVSVLREYAQSGGEVYNSRQG